MDESDAIADCLKKREKKFVLFLCIQLFEKENPLTSLVRAKHM